MQKARKSFLRGVVGGDTTSGYAAAGYPKSWFGEDVLLA